MKLLVLGGTRFLGRHLVDLALARGDEVTVFTRGKQPNHWAGAVAALAGNRDQAISPGLAALEQGTWDAVVDTSRLRAARRAPVGGIAEPARRPLSFRVVDFGVHGREPAGLDGARSRGRPRGSEERGDRQVLRSAQGGAASAS